MNDEQLWNVFVKSGKIGDYLIYKGIFYDNT